jgi:hypothetical protein
MKPTGRREAPPDDRLREIRDRSNGPSPHCASLHAAYKHSFTQKKAPYSSAFFVGR